MLNLSVRTKILSLIALFSIVIIGLSISSALSSKSVSSELQSLSSQSLQLVKHLEKSRQLLLQQSVEFERGYFQVSIAKSMGGYGTELIAESEEKFKAYTDELLTSIDSVKGILNEMPENDGLTTLLEHIDLLEEQQATFLKASTETYGWWIKLKTLQANKARRIADASLESVNAQMEIIISSINEYSNQVADNQNSKLDQTIYASGGLAALLIMIGVTISLLIVNGICRPLIKAVRRAEGIASGDLSQEPVNVTSRYKCGLLFTAFHSPFGSGREGRPFG